MHNSTSGYIWRRSQTAYLNPGPATLVSWSEVHAPLSGHEAYAPYLVAIVKLTDSNQTTAQLVDCRQSDLRVGMKLIPTFRKIYDTGPKAPLAYGYKFMPVHV